MNAFPILHIQSTPYPIPNKTNEIQVVLESRAPAKCIFQCQGGQRHLQAEDAIGCTTEHRYPAAEAEPG